MFDRARQARRRRTTPSQPELSAHAPLQPAHGAAGRPIPTPARSGARSSSRAGNPDGSVLAIDVDYLVFTPVITNTCPNRRTFSGTRHRTRRHHRHGRHSRAPDDHHHHPCFAEPRRLIPPGQNAKYPMRLSIPGTPSRGGPGGATALLMQPPSSGPPAVDSSNRSPVATSGAANSVEAGSRSPRPLRPWP